MLNDKTHARTIFCSDVAIDPEIMLTLQINPLTTATIFDFSILHFLKASLRRINSNRPIVLPYCSLNMRMCWSRQPAIVASSLGSWKNLNENLKFLIFRILLSHRKSTCPSKCGDSEM